MGKPGRPRKNALVELEKEKEQKADEQVENKPEPELMAKSDSNDLMAMVHSSETEIWNEIKKLKAELKTARSVIDEMHKTADKRTLSSDALSRIKLLIEDSVRKSDNIEWRKEGKSLLAQIDKVLI